MNEQAVLAEIGRLYLIQRELEAALAQARAERCPDAELHREAASVPATEPP